MWKALQDIGYYEFMKTKFNTNLTFLTPKAQGYVQSLVYWAKPTPSTDQVSWIKNYITHITDLVILKVPKLVRILEFYLSSQTG